MRVPSRRALLVALCGAAFAMGSLGASAVGDDRGEEDEDHDAARDALERGEVLPFGDILDRVQGQLPGRILEVEFEREEGVWVYEFKVLRADGRRVEVLVDGASGAILSRGED